MKMEGKWFGKNGALDGKCRERGRTGVRDKGGECRRETEGDTERETEGGWMGLKS